MIRRLENVVIVQLLTIDVLFLNKRKRLGKVTFNLDRLATQT